MSVQIVEEIARFIWENSKLYSPPNVVCRDDAAGYPSKEVARFVEHAIAQHSLSSTQKAEIREKLLAQFKRANLVIKKPSLIVPQCKSHFLMVSIVQATRVAPLEIRPTMLAKWNSLKKAIQMTGAKVTVLDKKGKQPYAHAFPRDSYFCVGSKVFFPDPRAHETIATIEQGDWISKQKILHDSDAVDTLVRCKELFMRSSIKDVQSLIGLWFEAGNVIVNPHRKTIFLGYENDPDMANKAGMRLNSRVTYETGEQWSYCMVPLADCVEFDEKEAVKANKSPLYHIDLVMSEPLQNGEVLICKEGTTSEVYEQIRKIIGDHNLINISLEEARSGVINMASNGMAVIMSRPSERLTCELEKRGYTVLSSQHFGLDNFNINLGGPHCLTNVI